MKTKKLVLTALFAVMAAGLFGQGPAINTLTEKEKKEGWRLLFDGKSISDWRKYRSDKPGAAWKVKDGILYLDASNKVNGKIVDGGTLITREQYKDFEFSIDWKIEPCGNSGIFFNVVEEGKGAEDWNTGPEIQVLDNACHPDAKFPKHRAGNLYDLIASTTESVKPGGEWNNCRIVSNKGHLVIWLNDVKQAEVQMYTPEWDALVKASKFKDTEVFAKSRQGFIGLQDHENQVSFRNIKIRKLP